MDGSMSSLERSRKINPGFRAFLLLLPIYIKDNLVEFDDNTFVCAYADDLVIARISCNKDMIIASLQPQVDRFLDGLDG